QYTEEKIVREDAMSGWDKKDVKAENGMQNIDWTAEKSVTKYLPKGAAWYEFYSEQKYQGGRNVTVPTAIDRNVMFVKAGSIIPLAPEMQYAQEKKWDNLDLIVYTGADASFTLYEDEGDNYNYEKGAYSTIEMTWNEKTRTLTLGAVKGQFPGMLTSRKFNVRIAGTQQTKTIDYAGQEVAVKL
ncbi:MAG: DUF5110 domain-containing protein, partial [Bacteroidales bacterium]|nr:DUF5110 domain-containing protein [Bacteroidales bacterium]